MMYGILVFGFVIVCLLLVGIILLQSSSGGMGTAIAGQAMNNTFGGQGADKLLVRVTSVLAFTFMVLAITIGWLGHPDSSNVDFSKPVISNRGSDVIQPTINSTTVQDTTVAP
mgnify:FL=1